jgi:hypothetical protein
VDDPYAEVKAHFADVGDVEVNAGRGAQGIKRGGKMFVMFYKGDLLVQLAPERVTELVAAGEGVAFDPGTGKATPDRVLIPSARRDAWVALCEESRLYVAGKRGRR